jgi:hypothetical protein
VARPEVIYVVFDGVRIAQRVAGKWVAKSGYEVWDEDDGNIICVCVDGKKLH